MKVKSPENPLECNVCCLDQVSPLTYTRRTSAYHTCSCHMSVDWRHISVIARKLPMCHFSAFNIFSRVTVMLAASKSGSERGLKVSQYFVITPQILQLLRHIL